MQLLRVVSVAAVCAALSACSSGGINGRVTVAGGSASGIAVFAYGPTSGAAVTGSDGAFALTGLDDGDYVLRAAVSGTDEGEQSVAVTVKGGKPSGDVTLAFHFSSGTLTGHVAFADGSDATGLSVIATGPETKSATTEAGGAFTLSNLKSGAYIVSVEAPNTREGRVSIAALASGAVDVGELRLTPIGRLTGTVTYNTAAAAGVTVTVPGTSVSSVTDATGAFELVNVPTGARTVMARTGEAPFWRSASADVTVVRGDNAAVDLALTDDAPRTGTVKGVVTFFTSGDPTGITVTAEGAGVSIPVTASGAFSLSVPVGAWNITAKAALYPERVLGHVVVHEGETIELEGQRLSWYRPIWTIDGTVTSLSTVSSTQATSSYSLVVVATTLAPSRLALLNVETGDLRFLATSYDNAVLGRQGKYAVWTSGRTVFVYTIATGALASFMANITPDSFGISDDETTIFLADYTFHGLQRVSIATPSTTVVFPADGGANSVFNLDNNRWVVMTPGPSTYDYISQVTTSTIVTTESTVGSYSPVLLTYKDDGVNTVGYFYPNDGGAVISAGTAPTGSYVYNFNITPASNPCSLWVTPSNQSAFCTSMTDGSRVQLPNDVSNVVANEGGNRLAFNTYPSDGGARGFYETAVPPPASATPVDTSATGWNFTWISPTRVVAIESNTSDGRKLRVVNSGTPLAVDTDTADGGSYLVQQAVITRQKSTGNWRIMLGDAQFRTLPVSQGVQFQTYAGRSLPVVTKYAAVGFGPTYAEQSTYAVDENAGMVRNLGFGSCSTAARSGAIELANCSMVGLAASRIYDFRDKTWVDFNDDTNTVASSVGNIAVRTGRVSISVDGHSVLLGTYGD